MKRVCRHSVFGVLHSAFGKLPLPYILPAKQVPKILFSYPTSLQEFSSTCTSTCMCPFGQILA